MIKRMLFLTLGVWMMLAGTAFAAPGHCAVRDAGNVAEAAPAPMSDHCKEMMGIVDTDMPDAPMPADDSAGDTCCCPAVMTALPATLLPPADTAFLHASWASPMGESAVSYLYLLDAPPPRA